MSGIIQLLPHHVANQIAAGEVVQRPASVVKELLENAVDAKATDIKLIVKDGGKTLVQVIDNGKGMRADDAQLCFSRHATSKIKQAEDLFALRTKGFRGEALAAISAIAQVSLKTRMADEELGVEVMVEGSKMSPPQPAVLPLGTSFSVKNLFFNIPARRNFLKSDVVEFKHVSDEFHRVALAHPDIQFSLHHNNSELYHLPVSNLRQRLVNLFGGKTNEKLVPVRETTDIVAIEGYIGKPEFAKKNRGEQFFFVNDRFIKSGYLHHAVMAAYEGLLKEGCQPAYFLYLSLPTESIDINIHPTKTEIKFDDEQALYAILRASVKHSLGQFQVIPALDFDRDATLETPYEMARHPSSMPTVSVDRNFNPFADSDRSQPASRTSTQKAPVGAWESLYAGLQADVETLEAESEPVPSLFSEPEADTAVSKTYQIHKKYIVNPIKSGMVIVDQQRAHQRILYEQFLTNMTLRGGLSQQLLFPLDFYYAAQELRLLRELQPALETTGFVFSEISHEKLTIVGLPIKVAESEASIVLEELLSDLQDGIPSRSYSQNDEIAKSMARSLAVKTGTYLTPAEQENLINGLFACKEAAVSPFGKPTFVTISVEDLDKKFAL